MIEKSTDNRSHRAGGIPLIIVHYTLRLLQLICALATIVIWGGDIQSARNSNNTIHSDWIFSVVISSISLIVTIIWMVPQITHWRFFFVDGALSGFWLIVFAIWGRNYIPRTCGSSHNCQELKVSVWFSLAAWLMWIITTVIGFIMFNRDRKYTHSGSWINTIRGGRAKTGYPHSNV
ncbi:hypothetical protein BGX38DRAFT_1086150 [Terfezia claveryi]|nr:hypothetical protein BGX38DRAFT_1086150 [Terfezia claveryi]